jgi:hypothetical protein
VTRKPAESQDQDKAQATVPNTVVKGTNPGVGVSRLGLCKTNPRFVNKGPGCRHCLCLLDGDVCCVCGLG